MNIKGEYIMNIDIETVKFIGMLNHLAYLTGICKEPIPFGEKAPKLLKCAKMTQITKIILFFMMKIVTQDL